jgi:hypothetical protein
MDRLFNSDSTATELRNPIILRNSEDGSDMFSETSIMTTATWYKVPEGSYNQTIWFVTWPSELQHGSAVLPTPNLLHSTLRTFTVLQTSNLYTQQVQWTLPTSQPTLSPLPSLLPTNPLLSWPQYVGKTRRHAQEQGWKCYLLRCGALEISYY